MNARANFLRPPRTAAELVADALRVAGALGVVVAAIGWTATDAGVVAFALPALMLPRILGARPWFDIAVCVAALVAAWSNVVDAYTTVPGWDLIVHAVATGLLAGLVYLLFAAADVVREPLADRRATRILMPVLGLALSAVWEMVEWAGWRFLSPDIYVAYQDTIGDMAAGGLGAVVVGFLLARVPALRAEARSATTPRPEG